MSNGEKLTREDAISLAVACARAKPESYYLVPFQPHEWVIDAIMEASKANRAEVERLNAALSKISAIRDSIVGAQRVDWSEHIYPLVAELDAAGFEGAGFEIARENLGTLIEQVGKVEAERDAYRAMLCDVIASAHPNKRDHPSMSLQWDRAIAMLKDGPK